MVISHTHNEILKEKNFTGSEFEGTPKLFKAFFSRLFLWQNYDTRGSNLGSFSSTDLKFGSFIAK